VVAGHALAVLALVACGTEDADRAGNRASTLTAEGISQPTEPATVTSAPEEAEIGATTTDPGADTAELEAIVRAWSTALNAGDNDAAAALFAPGAVIFQGGLTFGLPDHAAAVRWNADLPCSGTITEISTTGSVVLAVFALGDRTTSRCDAPPGTLAAAAFLIENGRIAVWQQVPVPDRDAPDQVAVPAAAPPATAA
jgi:hypothetical protein